MINHKIETFVDKHLETIFIGKHDIINWLKNHERKHLLIERLTGEINKVILTTAIHMDNIAIEKLTKEFTLMFASAAIKEKQKKLKRTILDKNGTSIDISDISDISKGIKD